MNNLYWNVYRSLERELLDIADTIHIDDKQLSTYSTRIANLLVRTVIEIESISKKLYDREGGAKPAQGNYLYFDTDCLALLEEKWNLSKKVVIISSPRLYVTNETHVCFMPLNRASKIGKPSWKKAYQAVKHNRAESLSGGNIKHFIQALGALFLLNLYYKDQRFDLYKDEEPRDFDEQLGSSIFSIKIHPFSGYINPRYKVDDAVDECVYLISITDKSKLGIQSGLDRLNCILEKHAPKFLSLLPQGQDQFNRIDDLRQKIKELDTFPYFHDSPHFPDFPNFPNVLDFSDLHYLIKPKGSMTISSNWIKNMLQRILDGIEYEVVTNKRSYKKHPM